jgi:hypothetical protein
MMFINPKTDYAFKKIFGSSESKDILISFLNALIYDGNSTIEDLEIINLNLPPKAEGLKDSYLDVKAKLQDDTFPEIMDSVPEIHQAFDIANQVKLSREEVEEFDRREQFIYDQQGAIIKASREGREEGIEEGMQFEKLAIAQNLLSQLDNATISQVTGLSLEDVQNLREAKLSQRESRDA